MLRPGTPMLLLDGGRLHFMSTPEEFLNSEEPRLVRFLGDRLD